MKRGKTKNKSEKHQQSVFAKLIHIRARKQGFVNGNGG